MILGDWSTKTRIKRDKSVENCESHLEGRQIKEIETKSLKKKKQGGGGEKKTRS